MVLAGRQDELRELVAAAEVAFAVGRGWTALVGGEPGIGKSRLVAEFAAWVRTTGVPVAWAACRQDGGAPPYWPWAQLLTQLGHPEALNESTAEHPRESSTTGDHPEQHAEQHPDHPPGEIDRFLLFQRIADVIRGSAPLVLVIDDLHWADEPSLRLLDSLPTHLGPAPVIIVGTYRDTEAGAALLAGLSVERRLLLRGLRIGDLGAAIEDATGGGLAPEVLARVHRLSGGNPFFAAEVVRLWRAEPHDGDHGLLPGGVRAVLDRRIDRLPADTENVLKAAAILDAGTVAVDAVLLAATSGRAPGELADLIAPAIDARLMIATQGRFRFPHELIAEAMRVRTPRSEQVGMHRRAAAALSARFGAGLVGAAEPARHLLSVARACAEPDDVRAAARAARAAADEAMRRTAYEDAVDWLGQCIDLPPAVPDEPATGTPVADDERGDMLCALGDALLAAGRTARSRAAFREAADLARRPCRPQLLAAAALGFTGGAAGFEVDLAEPDRLVLLEEAAQLLPDADSPIRCAVLSRLSVALSFTGAEDRRRHLADQAVDMARRLGDPRALGIALAARCDAVSGPDHIVLRRSAATEIVDCALRTGDLILELLGHRLRLVACAEAGDWPAVDAEISTCAALLRLAPQPALVWYLPMWRAARAAMRGDEDGYRQETTTLRALVDRSGSNNARLLESTQQFIRAVTDDRPADAFEAVRRLQAGHPELESVIGASVTLLLALTGNRAEAAGRLAKQLAQERVRDSEWLPETVQLAMVAITLEDPGAAEPLYRALQPYAGMFAIEGILAGTWGSVDGQLGRLAGLLGRHEDARAHLARARELDSVGGRALADRHPSGTTRPDKPAEPAATTGEFTLEGDVWTISYAGRRVRLKDAKGLRDLAALLARPGRDIAVHELAGADPSAARGSASYPLADRAAIDAYRRRLTDLEADAAEAARHHDPVRLARAEGERDALVRELAAVTGLGNRARRAGSDLERMRKAVGNRVRLAIARIDREHPELGRHLRASVHTGTFCRYEPELSVRWTVRDHRAGPTIGRVAPPRRMWRPPE